MIKLKSPLPSRLTWAFWPEKEFTDVYENIYVRTFTEDWFNIVQTMAIRLDGAKLLLDVGCGEGHTTKQILDRLNGPYLCDLLEPSSEALASAKNFLEQENLIGEVFNTTLEDFKPSKTYDAVFTSHTNYYWAKNQENYDNQLKKYLELVKTGGKALVLTLPAGSDQYKVLLKDPYQPFARAEYIQDFYQNLKHDVEVMDFSMRLYIGDLFTTKSLYDAKNFYRFLHGVRENPNDKDTELFLDKINKFRKGEYLDFKDRLLIVTRTS